MGTLLSWISFPDGSLASVTTCYHRQCLEAIRVQPSAAGLRQTGRYSSLWICSGPTHVSAHSPSTDSPRTCLFGGEGTFVGVPCCHTLQREQQEMFRQPFLKRASTFLRPGDALRHHSHQSHSKAAHQLCTRCWREDSRQARDLRAELCASDGLRQPTNTQASLPCP